MTEPIPLQVEHVTVEFVVEPFCLSGRSLRTMKTSAQWCLVDISYFTHNWETRGWRKRLIPSRAGPKDLPTASLLKNRQASELEGAPPTEQIFNLIILCEKYLQHRQDLYHVFIDIKKALDKVWHAVFGQPWRSATSAPALFESSNTSVIRPLGQSSSTAV